MENTYHSRKETSQSCFNHILLIHIIRRPIRYGTIHKYGMEYRERLHEEILKMEPISKGKCWLVPSCRLVI